jgi:hypothetical protein
MKTNMGSVDRVIRVFLGLILLSGILFLDPGIRWWGLIGLIPLTTAAIGWCPAYLPFGISTCKTGDSKA